MKYKLIHTNHLGQVATIQGDMKTHGSDSQAEFYFDSLEEASAHSEEYIKKFPVLMCTIYSEDQKDPIIISNSKAIDEYHEKFCTVDRKTDVIVGLLMLTSVISNVVLGFIVFFKR